MRPSQLDALAPAPEARAHSERVTQCIVGDIERSSGWISFARYMELALYAPGLGYYNAGARKFGAAGDFVTAPEISPLFARTLARSLAQALPRCGAQVLELGAGSGVLAVELLAELERLDATPERYSMLEISPDLRARQRDLLAQRLPHLAARVDWLTDLPESFRGVIIGNEFLDALPVHLIVWRDAGIFERGVALEQGQFVWRERPAQGALLAAARAQTHSLPHPYVSEISLAQSAYIARLARLLQRGLILFFDYGFPASEYYHPQRSHGTLMCHYRHHAHDDPFYLPGLQDITAHVDFTSIAQTARDAGLELLGYTTQANFLLASGITDLLAEERPAEQSLALRAQLQRLVSPAEMGELVKVIAFGRDVAASAFAVPAPRRL